MQIKFSVIIPSYNRATLIKRAINSVLFQTYTNWELIIIDNESTDNTEEIINKYHDKRIAFLKISNKGVIAKSRNLGLKNATGDWIAFLDSDDWWHKEKLSICFKYINSNTDLIYHKLIIKSRKNKFFLFERSLNTKKLKKPIARSLLINGNVINNSSVVIRKNIIDKVKGLSEEFNLVTAEDYNLWLKISNISNNFKFINRNLGFYFIHESNTLRHDMSIPTRAASLAYINNLSESEKELWDSNLLFMSARYYYLIENYRKAFSMFNMIFYKVSFYKKIKIIIMYLYKLVF